MVRANQLIIEIAEEDTNLGGVKILQANHVIDWWSMFMKHASQESHWFYHPQAYN